jgi:hypothetical protein
LVTIRRLVDLAVKQADKPGRSESIRRLVKMGSKACENYRDNL